MKENHLQVEYINIEVLKKCESNTRTHSPAQIEQLSRSMTEFGFTNPVLIDECDELIAGHGRLAAAKLLGLKKVPAIRLRGLSDTQKRALRIADNQLALNAGWDDEMLSKELAALETAGFDLSLTGFDLEEIEGLLDFSDVLDDDTPNRRKDDGDDIDGDESDVSDDEQEIVAAPAFDPVTKVGDVWALGSHRLVCGSSTSEKDVATLLDGVGRADLLFTSPPYADLRTYNGDKDLSVEHISQFIKTYAPYVDYQCVNLGLKFKDREVVPYWDDYIAVGKEAGYKLMAWCVWDKGQCGSVGQQNTFIPTRHEWIFVFGRMPKALNKTVAKKACSIGVVKPCSVRQADGSVKMHSIGDTSCEFKSIESVTNVFPEKGPIRQKHPATFPVALPTEYIKALTQAGAVIIEPFGGSGTTLIAAERLGRACCIMELDPKYCDVIIDRWQSLTGGEAVRADGVTFNSLREEA